MIPNRDKLLMMFLDCKEKDLKIIDRLSPDFFDFLNIYTLQTGDINDLLDNLFDYGLDVLNEDIFERTLYFESKEIDYGISDEERQEYLELKKLYPYTDFQYTNNSFYHKIECVKNQEIYQKYLYEAIDNFYDETGFKITFFQPFNYNEESGK